jgi:NAD+ synthase
MKKKIVHWLKREIADAGAKGIVMGLSGGVDSAVVCALAKETVGKDRVLALLMPCYSSLQDLMDARIIARKLGVRTKLVDLSNLYAGFLKVLPKAGRVALANLKPRLRMAALYYFANKYNYLVCGTGNKTESLCGYFTKYGDGGVDLLPIGNLLKKQVRRLAKELGIPQQIIDKPPSAGLWQGQTDEGEMGITYAELDDILERMERKQKQVLPEAKVEKIRRMIKASEHKRQGPKICR